MIKPQSNFMAKSILDFFRDPALIGAIDLIAPIRHIRSIGVISFKSIKSIISLKSIKVRFLSINHFLRSNH